MKHWTWGVAAALLLGVLVTAVVFAVWASVADAPWEARSVTEPTATTAAPTAAALATAKPKYTAEEVAGIVKARPSQLFPGDTVEQATGSMCDSSIKQQHPEIVSELNFAVFQAVYQGDGRWGLSAECYACSSRNGPCNAVIGERMSVGSFLENGSEFIEH